MASAIFRHLNHLFVPLATVQFRMLSLVLVVLCWLWLWLFLLFLLLSVLLSLLLSWVASSGVPLKSGRPVWGNIGNMLQASWSATQRQLSTNPPRIVMDTVVVPRRQQGRRCGRVKANNPQRSQTECTRFHDRKSENGKKLLISRDPHKNIPIWHHFWAYILT